MAVPEDDCSDAASGDRDCDGVKTRNRDEIREAAEEKTLGSDDDDESCCDTHDTGRLASGSDTGSDTGTGDETPPEDSGAERTSGAAGRKAAQTRGGCGDMSTAAMHEHTLSTSTPTEGSANAMWTTRTGQHGGRMQ